MTYLFQFGISNAIIATGVAGVVVLLTMRSKSPAWTHALWVLVLVKLVTPPIVWFDSDLRLPATSQSAAQSKSLSTGMAPAVIAGLDAPDHVVASESDVFYSSVQTNSVSSAGGSWWSSLPWLRLLGGVWVIGVAFYLICSIYYFVAARRWIGQGVTAPPAMMTTVNRVCKQVGLRRCPCVVVVSRNVTPSVFAIGRRSTLVLPAFLVDQLSSDELDTIIAHELIHVRRGDGWVRLLELLAGALFWWHPLLPMVRRRIHQAAEEACDAWVTSILPHATAAYASAMLKTVDFLSDEPAVAMPMATGMGDVASLSKRMRQISQRATPPRMSWSGKCATVLIALVLLPLGVLTLPQSMAQQPPATTPADKPALVDPANAATARTSDTNPRPNKSTQPPGATPGRVQLPNDPNAIDPSGVEDALRKNLSRKASCNVVNEPLVDFVKSLAEQCEVPIFVHATALEEIGLTPDIPVTLDVKNLSLRSILKLALRPLDLSYVIKDEVILITTPDAAEQNLTLKAYALPVALKDRSEKVIVALKENVVRDTWDSLGGPSTASAIDNVLVVSTTEVVHEAVDAFLKSVEAAFNRRKK